ncbi:MAG: U32 family peptidase, partial [Woeseiaceae bacterium]
MLAGKSTFVGGPSLNIYNPRTLAKLVHLGMTRWVMPVELSRIAFAGFKEEMPVGIECEAFAWGRLPLAYS